MTADSAAGTNPLRRGTTGRGIRYMHWLPENRDIALKGNRRPWALLALNRPETIRSVAAINSATAGEWCTHFCAVPKNLTHLHQIASGKNLGRARGF